MTILDSIKCKSSKDVRLYDYCNGKFKQLPSRKSLKKAIDQELVLVNGIAQKTGFWLRGGEQITLITNENKPPKPYKLDLEILFEDDYLIMVNKPAGLRVSGNQFKTLSNVLAYNFTKSQAEDALGWPLPVHRLDQPTSGIVISAKSKRARIRMGKLFEEQKIEKYYHAIVIGEPENLFESFDKIDEKEAESHFEKLRTVNSLRSGKLSLVKINPKTGRKHQIRKHLSSLGFPILGDQIYSASELKLKHKGMFLCATEVKFSHPITNRLIHIELDLPKKYEKRLESENKRWQNTMQA